MADKFLHHRLGRTMDDRFDPAPSADSGGVDDFHSFGWLRGIRERATMLELRKKSGDVMAIGYSWIERVEFNPTEGITLHVHGEKIRIKGRNLNAETRPEVRLLQGIARHRVAWVQEADRPGNVNGGERATIVEEIVW
jgi:RNase P/RNase MRP subunit p29